ncbi:phage major capsid protein [Synergistes jonesii]|uniref:phage major capsid protein n=1 Tax=Synergistes jonesii TaxID=2754 RepID=UPI00248E0936|nr:phage major capsid protein [Synergistes jonesii]
MAKTLRELAVEIAKADGALTPEMVNVGGTLRAEQSNKWINLIVSKSPILSLVTVDKSSKLKKDVNVCEFITGVLQRVPQGTEPSKSTSFANVGKELDMKAAQLYSYITFDYLRDNKDKPGLENEAASYLAEVYSRDITKLAFVGENDDYLDGDPTKGKFERLNKGWPQLIKEASGSHKVNISDYVAGGAVSWTAFLSAMIAEMPAIYKSDKCRLLMNSSDYEDYCYQVGNLNGAVGILISGQVKEFLGYKIEVVPDMPRQTVIFTPLANLVYGVNTIVERYRELKGTKRVIDYTYDSAFDFQVAVDDAAVIGYATA